MNAMLLILGGAIAGAAVALAAAAAVVRHWPRIAAAVAVPVVDDGAAPEQAPATAPFSASPPQLADAPSGRHASGAPAAPRHTPERDVERTHLMRAVQVAGPIRVADPTGLAAAEIVAALDRRAAGPYRR